MNKGIVIGISVMVVEFFIAVLLLSPSYIQSTAKTESRLVKDAFGTDSSYYVIQKANYRNEFQIRLTGYESYCYFDEVSSRHYAMIKPLFLIRRIRTTDESRVDFNFYTETIKGPPAFLGKKTYFEAVSLSADENEKEFKGKAVEVKIPQEMMYEFEIFAGLVISPQGKVYNQRFFDVDMEYDDAASETKIYETKIKEYPPLYNQDGTFAE